MNKYSFKDLLTDEIIIEDQKGNIKKIIFQKIEIPIIQRDYAQGRENEFEVRSRFLNSIFTALISDESLEMDFVYGSFWESSDDKKENAFIPLDGQQRLTTLFLLYWYIGSRELDQAEFYKLQQFLNKFTYATRVSARRFCEGLVKTKISFIQSPKSEITNLPWFFNSYKKDPTVTSMLNMLDAIHKKYIESHNNTNQLFDNLQKLQFYVLPLDGFGLTEELYVKMNARGKQLTDFENLKADLIKWMKDDVKNQKAFNKNVILHERKMPYYMAFSERMDITWTNFFWTITQDYDEEKKDKTTGNLIYPNGKIVDPLFMRFFRRYLCNLSISDSKRTADEIEKKDSIFRYFYGQDDSESDDDESLATYRSFDNYEQKLSVEVLSNTEKILNWISKHWNSIRKCSQPSWDKDSLKLFDRSINQRQRAAFFATTVFIENNDIYSETAFKKWMRFVWNIIIDPNLRNIPAMIGAIRFLAETAKHSGDINYYLANCKERKSAFAAQFEEECIKAKLIMDKNNDWENEIVEAEAHPLFKGSIRFLLRHDEKTSFEDFNKNKEAAFEIFENNDSKDSPQNYLWMRAILAESKEKETKLPIVLSNGRFDNWRDLINSKFTDAFREVLDQVVASDKPAEEVLDEICENYERDPNRVWIYPLVRWVGENGETLLGDFSETRRIKSYNNYGNDPEQIYLFNKTRWTEGNVILSNYRNEILAELIAKHHIDCSWDWYNIQGRFFRGWDIKVKREFNDYPFEFLFDRQHLRVGIKDSEDLPEDLRDRISVKFEDDEKANGWICSIIFDYQNEVKDESGIKPFIERINNEVFNKENSESVFSKIKRDFKMSASS